MYPDFSLVLHDRCHNNSFIFADSRDTDPSGVIVKALYVRCDGSMYTASLDDTFDTFEEEEYVSDL